LRKLKKIINSNDFLNRHRKAENYFIRKFTLTFPVLIIFLMNILRNSIQRELNQYFKIKENSLIADIKVTKSAFTKARKKFSYTAFIELNNHLINEVQQSSNLKTWLGHNLIAIDGSTVNLPNADEIVNHFGTQPNGTEKKSPLARISQSYDVMNKISLDCIISPIKNTDELSLSVQHFQKAKHEDLFLLDRNYPAFWLFSIINYYGANYCARVKNHWSKISKKFYESGKSSEIITLTPAKYQIKQLIKLGLPAKPFKVRFVRVELDSGETEILITSLLDQNKYSTRMFKELYFCRWPIEEDYKIMKHRLEVENFSGKTVESIYQDFHAKILTKNLTSILISPVKEVIDINTVERKFEYQTNFTEALSNMKNTIILLFKLDNPVDIIKQFHKLAIIIIEPIRKERKYPRLKRIKRRTFPLAYKAI
jgi:hypothetical protein